MTSRKRFSVVAGLLFAVALLLSACGPPYFYHSLSQCGYCPFGPEPRHVTAQSINFNEVGYHRQRLLTDLR